MKTIMYVAVFAAALMMVFAGIPNPVAAQYYGTGEPTSGSWGTTRGLSGVSSTINELVASIDSCFGLVTSSTNLNAMLRNLSAAIAVLVQHSLNEIVGAFNFALHVGLIGCLCFGVGSLAAIPTFLVIGIIGLIRAFIDALARFTAPAYFY